MYCLWPLLHILLVCTTLVCLCTPVLLLYAVLVPTLLLFLAPSVYLWRRGESLDDCLSLEAETNNKFLFFQLLSYIVGLAVPIGHSLPLHGATLIGGRNPHLLLVCTTLVCVLFVATPMSTISV